MPPESAVTESCAKERVVVASGTPLIMKAAEEDAPLPVKTKMPEPVAFWKKKFVVEAVVTFRLVPVAFVKVRFVKVELGLLNSEDEASPPEKTENTGLVAPTTFSNAPERAVEVPMAKVELEKRNLVELFTWKFRKSPSKMLLMFDPRSVPEAEPPERGFAPSVRSDDVAAKANGFTVNVPKEAVDVAPAKTERGPVSCMPRPAMMPPRTFRSVPTCTLFRDANVPVSMPPASNCCTYPPPRS